MRAMDVFLATVLAFPTVVFTIFLGVVLLYWLTVIAGIFDLDALDSVSGAADAKAGVLDGAAEAMEAKAGMLDGAAEAIEAKAGMLDGAAEALEAKAGMLDGAAEAMEAKAAAFDGFVGGLDGQAGAVDAAGMAAGRGRVPLTIRFSLFVLGGWITSFLVVYNTTADAGAASTTLTLAATGAALVGGWLAATLTGRVLAPLFQVTRAPNNMGLIGTVCTISTGRVDEHFGQASINDGGAGLIIHVRCEPGLLGRNDEAMIIAWNATEFAFRVTPMDSLQV